MLSTITNNGVQLKPIKKQVDKSVENFKNDIIELGKWKKTLTKELLQEIFAEVDNVEKDLTEEDRKILADISSLMDILTEARYRCSETMTDFKGFAELIVKLIDANISEEKLNNIFNNKSEKLRNMLIETMNLYKTGSTSMQAITLKLIKIGNIIKRKKEENVGTKNEKISGKRKVAYGGAGGVTILAGAAGVAALNLWNPVGWVVGAAVVVGSGAAFGVAAGVTEGELVPEIKRVYDALDTSIQNFIERNKNQQQNIVEQAEQLHNQHDQLDQIRGSSDSASDYEEWNLLQALRTELNELKNLCDDFLKN